MAGNVFVAATGERLRGLGIDLDQLGRHGRGCVDVFGRVGVDGGAQDCHDWNPRSLAANDVRISVVPPPIPMMRMSRYCRSISLSVI